MHFIPSISSHSYIVYSISNHLLAPTIFILSLTISSFLQCLFYSYLLIPTLSIPFLSPLSYALSPFLSPNSYSFSIPCSFFLHCLTASLTISSFLWPDSEEQRMGLHQEPQIRHRQQGQVRLSLWQLDFLGDHWGRVRGCEGLLYCRVLGRWLRFFKIGVGVV